MNELHAVLDAWREVEKSGREAVLATVVHVTGSAYRRPGARMLIRTDGERVGSISGGCLEGDLCRKAWWFTENGRPTVRVYDTTSEDDAVWEFGLGCNGVVHVLLERVEAEATRAALAFLDRCRAARREAVVATVIRAHPASGFAVGDRLLADVEGGAGGVLQGTSLETALSPQIETCFAERGGRLVHLRDCDVFLEWIGPPTPLVVFGGGHDAVPLVAMAKQMGWEVTVADGRPAYARHDRFAEVDAVVLMRSADADPLAGIEIGPRTVVVLMTHNYPQDASLLRAILPKRPRYLGLLGPRRRTERLFAEIGADAGGVDVHAPVGLDLGASTPEGIALSIVAEVQATLAGRAGGELRLRSAPIHAPVAEVGSAGVVLEEEAERPACDLAVAHA